VAEVQCLDVLEDAPPWFRWGYGWTYLLLVRRMPWIWKWSYRILDGRRAYDGIQPLRRWWNLVIVGRFVRRLKSLQPDAVIATHFLPADVCSAGKRAGWLRGALVVVVTDFHPHRFWISREPEALVVGVPESAETLARCGVERSRVHVLGIPVGRAFGAPVDGTALRQRLRLSESRQTVLVTSGGTTVGQFERVVDSLLTLEALLPGRLQLLVVCGEDAGARRRLTTRATASPMPMRVFGFVDNMADLMAVSELVVAKAGGLTLSESLASGVPLILYHIIPGQERMNAQYAVRHGAAIIAHRPQEAAQAVRGFFEDASRAAAMRQAARALARPDAAEAIVSQVVQPLLQSVVRHG